MTCQMYSVLTIQSACVGYSKRQKIKANFDYVYIFIYNTTLILSFISVFSITKRTLKMPERIMPLFYVQYFLTLALVTFKKFKKSEL